MQAFCDLHIAQPNVPASRQTQFVHASVARKLPNQGTLPLLKSCWYAVPLSCGGLVEIGTWVATSSQLLEVSKKHAAVIESICRLMALTAASSGTMHVGSGCSGCLERSLAHAWSCCIVEANKATGTGWAVCLVHLHALRCYQSCCCGPLRNCRILQPKHMVLCGL